MALPLPSGSSKNERRHVESLSSDEGSSESVDSWPRFIVISSSDDNPLKLNPFAISLGIKCVCGEVKNVTRLRSSSLLVECARRQQSDNLLNLKQFVNTPVVVSVYETLNSCRGIVRDRARCLSDMSEEEIAAELQTQGITAVKRFTKKKDDGTITKLNTYLFTFALSSIPKSIKAGYFNIGVEVYVPNPLRCIKCQKFGHGAKFCRNQTECSRCGGAHEGSECSNSIKCANCNGEHLASSKSCPLYDRETKIQKIKHTTNISYFEAEKLVPLPTNSTLTYSAAVSSPVSVTRPTMTSTSCQTSISWVDKQLILDDRTQFVPSLPVIATSATQTDSVSPEPSVDPSSEPDIVSESVQGGTHISSKKKKTLKKKARGPQAFGGAFESVDLGRGS
ncbi:uncharacterized protein [Haliotis cracherodii]|uniref:uncharacterized protein n=1 Tax=Haliotis cracherodii TaxID=6455 RepID=UPI0039EC490E